MRTVESEDEPEAGAPADLVRLYTDGACSGNPGPGGWAYILKHPATGKVRDGWGAEPATTNNRMELLGAIRGLESLNRPCQVELVTDSQYVAKGVAEWLPKWKANGWRRREGAQWKPVKNEDLWKRLDELIATHHVTVSHVLGHRGHPENEACDRMAVAAYKALIADSTS
ncbi:MAG TPA: ribonuclease HI [Isosphaeraceae bacterium]|jgi:ribonuclease HI|nr:ribonuclease HI [Isosphaeraceae bacterium]